MQYFFQLFLMLWPIALGAVLLLLGAWLILSCLIELIGGTPIPY